MTSIRCPNCGGILVFDSTATGTYQFAGVCSHCGKQVRKQYPKQDHKPSATKVYRPNEVKYE